MVRARAIGWLFAALVFEGHAYAADEKLSCIDENVQAQKLEREGKLRAAHQTLVTCADAACPGAVRGDCATMLKQNEDSTPTISVSAKGVDGSDVSSVKVSLDDEAPIDEATGRAFAVDPGSHVVHVMLGDRHREMTVVFVEGQKDRPLFFDFTEKIGLSDVPGTPTPASHFRVPLVAWILGGVSVASAGAFVYFGVTGNSIKHRLDTTCASTRSCSDSDYGDMKSSYTAANVFAGVAAGALVVAVVTTLVWPRAKSNSIDVAFTGNGAALQGRF